MKWFARGAVAIVWLYNGFWCKLLEACPQHLEVVASVPFLPDGREQTLLKGIGALETLLALWVITGRLPRTSAFFQTVLLVAMNAGGLLWGRAGIPDPVGLVVQNIAFLALVWSLALSTKDERVRSA